MGYQFYIQNLSKKIRSNKDLSFMKSFQPKMDSFKHSGLACRGNRPINQMETNSIRRVEATKNFTEIHKRFKLKKTNHREKREKVQK